MEFFHYYKNFIIKYDTTFYMIYHKETRDYIFGKEVKCSLSESKYRAIAYIDNLLNTPVIRKISVKGKGNFNKLLNNKVNILGEKVI